MIAMYTWVYAEKTAVKSSNYSLLYLPMAVLTQPVTPTYSVVRTQVTCTRNVLRRTTTAHSEDSMIIGNLKSESRLLTKAILISNYLRIECMDYNDRYVHCR